MDQSGEGSADRRTDCGVNREREHRSNSIESNWALGKLASRCAMGLVVGLAFACSGLVGAQAQSIKLKVSLDTPPSHIRNQVVARYLDDLKNASGGRIEPELYQSGQLDADRDVTKALRQGSIAMAFPGTWFLGGIEPNFNIIELPIFYGQSAALVHKAMDGKVGQEISANLEHRGGVKVLGPWLDLGAFATFSSKHPIKDPADIGGMKIRIAGGAGLSATVKFLKAIPNATPWADVPLGLSQGTFDGLISSPETVASGKLWDAGIKYAVEDRTMFGQYVPLVNEAFWERLPPDLQKILADTWNADIGEFRSEAAKSQAAALTTLAANGIIVSAPGEDRLAALRTDMLVGQDATAKELKIDPKLLAELMSVLAPSQ
jgi:TRAP-type transport system periplasmic protein